MPINDRSDFDLLHACRAGDRDAFGEFYCRHREVLLSYLARRTTEPEVAADLLAETFASALIAVRDASRVVPETPVAWLYTIARNLLIDSVRRKRVEDEARRRLGFEPLVIDDDDVQRIIEIAHARDAVAELAQVVPASEWDTFRARVLESESYPELAARLRCSQAVVRKRVSRVKANLRTAMGARFV